MLKYDLFLIGYIFKVKKLYSQLYLYLYLRIKYMFKLIIHRKILCKNSYIYK